MYDERVLACVDAILNCLAEYELHSSLVRCSDVKSGSCCPVAPSGILLAGLSSETLKMPRLLPCVGAVRPEILLVYVSKAAVDAGLDIRDLRAVSKAPVNAGLDIRDLRAVFGVL